MKIATVLYALGFYLVAFILAPYIFIILTNFYHLPVLNNRILHFLGLLLILLGAGNTFYTYRFFWSNGKGTPVPIQQTKKLMTKGIYKYSRNPIYIVQFLWTIGIFFFFGQSLLIVYCLLYAIWAHLYILQEEKGLKERFGKDYIAYMKKVPRYF